MEEEINPRTGKPYSTNPRAVNARRQRTAKKSAESQAKAEEERGKQEIPQGEFENTPGYAGEPTYTDDAYVSPGTQLEQEGGYLEDADTVDTSQPLQMSDKDIEELTVRQNQQRDALSNLSRDEAIKKVIESTERNTKERADGLGEIAKQLGEDSLGYGLMALQKYGEAIDWTNDQVNLRNTLRIGGVETPFDAL